MMNFSLEMLFGVCLQKDESLRIQKFTLDELIQKTAECFAKRGLCIFAELIIKLTEEVVLSGIVGKSVDPGPALRSLTLTPCCAHSTFASKGAASRSVMSSIGKLQLSFRRIECLSCGRSLVPMRNFLGLNPHQNKSNELFKICLEAITDQSYRRSLYQIEELTAAELSLGGLWRMVMKSKGFTWSESTLSQSKLQNRMDESIKEIIKQDPIYAILADGTGFKLQRREQNLRHSDSRLETDAIPLQSEVRLIFAVTKSGVVLPMGTYGEQEHWREIGRDLYNRFGRNPKLKPEPIAEVLVSDGEEAIFEHLGRLARTSQRCQWHLTHDFKAVFQYQDDGKKEDRKKYQSAIYQAMKIEVEPGSHEDPEKRLKLEAEIHRAEKTLDELAERLDENNYHKSAGYLRNAAYKLFTFLRVYLRTGILGPKVTSRLERLMREVGRRIKRMAFNWSPRGVAVMSYLILIRAMNKGLWKKYWDQVLGVGEGIVIRLESAQTRCQSNPLPN